MTGEDGHRHRMVSRVVASGSADVGVRVDPEHRKLLPITLCQPGEGRHAHGALSTKREDALRTVAAYHLQGWGQLPEHGLLRFDPVLLRETKSELIATDACIEDRHEACSIGIPQSAG
jgi:hypothetical protein